MNIHPKPFIVLTCIGVFSFFVCSAFLLVDSIKTHNTFGAIVAGVQVAMYFVAGPEFVQVTQNAWRDASEDDDSDSHGPDVWP